MDKTEMLPCPFCGSAGEVEHNEGYQWWQAGCSECGCQISEVGCDCEADAIAMWNTRTHHAEIEAMARDAGRYRWLRDSPEIEVYFATDKNITGWGDWGSHDNKDEAIDAAMAKQSDEVGDGQE